MPDFKQIFAKHGYSLFEPESIENAIIDAIKERTVRYLYGIPILLENSNINYYYLAKLAKKQNISDELNELLYIASRIIKNKIKSLELKKIATKPKKITHKLNEFKEAYEKFHETPAPPRFPAELNYHLSFIFARKQIGVLYKIRTGEKLTKTEKEYFSRTIKKRLIAIRELAPFVKEIMPKG
jgi:hypothetical protein